MKYGYFYRKADNITDLNETLYRYPEYLIKLNYIISKKICLKKNDFKNFISDFKKSRKFIEYNIPNMHMDENDNLTCLLVYSNAYDYGILVYSAGYTYPRYVAKHFLN